MSRNPASCAWAAIAITILMGSCAAGDPPLPPWADDVQVTGYKWDAMPKKIELQAGHRLDLTLSFKWTRESGMFKERPVRPPAEWLVTGTVFTLDGEIAEPTPWSYQREFHDVVSRLGTERRLSDNFLVWVSPDPPKNMQAGRRYLWGRVQMPKEPGTYRLVVNLYPTIRFPGDSNPDRGPAEELYSVDVHVTPASVQAPSVGEGLGPSDPIRRMEIDKERGRLGAEAL
jgi:hypothetical protein